MEQIDEGISIRRRNQKRIERGKEISTIDASYKLSLFVDVNILLSFLVCKTISTNK
jgi:hypothetical protein